MARFAAQAEPIDFARSFLLRSPCRARACAFTALRWPTACGLRRMLQSPRDSPKPLLAIVGVASRSVVLTALPRHLLEPTWEHEDVALQPSERNVVRVTAAFPARDPASVISADLRGRLRRGRASVADGDAEWSRSCGAACGMDRVSAGVRSWRHSSRLLSAAGVTLHPALVVFSLHRHSLWSDSILFLATLLATFRLRCCRDSRLAHAGTVVWRGDAVPSDTWAPSWCSLCVARLAGGNSLGQWDASRRLGPRRALLIAAPWLVRNAYVFLPPTGMVSTNGINL